MTRLRAHEVSLMHTAAAEIERLKESNAELLEALTSIDAAVNPPDRHGISMHVWNQRLKAASKIVRAAIEKANTSCPLDGHLVEEGAS